MKKELRKHMARTADGKKYLDAEMRMEKITVGSVLTHQTRGQGEVVYIDPKTHSRHVRYYDSGEVHKYLPTSWHKMTLVKLGPAEKGQGQGRNQQAVAAPGTPVGAFVKRTGTPGSNRVKSMFKKAMTTARKGGPAAAERSGGKKQPPGKM